MSTALFWVTDAVGTSLYDFAWLVGAFTVPFLLITPTANPFITNRKGEDQ